MDHIDIGHVVAFIFYYFTVLLINIQRDLQHFDLNPADRLKVHRYIYLMRK